MLDQRGPPRGAARRPWRPRPRAGWSPSASRRRGPRPASAGSPRREPLPATCRACSRVAALHREAEPRRGREPAGRPARTSGTAACSCSRRGGCWPSWSAGRRTSWPRRAPPARTRPRAERRLDAAAYARIRSQPIDKAVMEQSHACRRGAGRPAVVRRRLLARDLGADGQGRAGQCRARATRSRSHAHDNLIRSEKRLVALAGVSGLAVIETADAAARGRPAEQRGGPRRGRRAGRARAPRDRDPRPRGAALGPVHGAARGAGGAAAGYKVKEVVRRRPRPADLPVSSRPRRDLGDRRGRGAGRARRRRRCICAPARASPYRAAPGIG